MENIDRLSAQDRMFLVQATYGKAMLRAHHLERSLATLLICQIVLATPKNSQKDAEIAKIKRLSLGILIDRFIREFSPLEETREELLNLLSFRNELAHRISDTIIDAAREEGWEQTVISELNVICTHFADCRPLLRPYMEKFKADLGLSDKKMKELMHTLYLGVNIEV